MMPWQFFIYTLVLVLGAAYFGWMLRGAMRSKTRDIGLPEQRRDKAGRFVSPKD
jgi:threonine/homoserine/homoserine lactone efflux protein